MTEDDRPFVVLKFLTHEGKRLTPDDDVFYAVGLTRWFTTELDENMEAQMKWPPSSVDAGSLVRKEKPPDPNWGEETVLIKRFYNLYDKAAASCKGYVEDSNYETDHRELGRGYRIKRKVQHLDSESEKESDSGSEDSSVKKRARTYLSDKNLSKSKKKVPAPPPVPFVRPGRFVVSPHEIVRQKQHTPQLEKQSTIKKTIVCKSFQKSHGKQVTKRIFNNMREKMQKEKDKKIMLGEKLCQKLRSNKLQKLCKDKASLYQDEETLDEQNVDDDLLDRNQSIEVGQNTEEEIVENLIESTIPLKQISEHQPSSTNTEVLLASSPKKKFVLNSASELKKNKPLPSLLSPAVDESSSFNDKSHANDNCLFQFEKSEKSGSSYTSQNNDSKKADISLFDLVSIYHNEIKKEFKELNSKVDFCLMNQEKLHRYILPGEKVIKRPTGFPSLPVQSEQELHTLETFLANDANLSAASMYLGRFVDKNSLDSSVKKLLRNVLSNDVANKFSFQGAKGKQKFEVLKTWEFILGALLLYFEPEDVTTAEKVASCWLANAPWRIQTDGTIRGKKYKKTE